MVIIQNAIIYTAVCDAATPLLIMISSGYFKHIKDRIISLNENGNCKLLDQKRCIYFHQRLLRFSSKLAEFAATMLLTQILSTGYNISIILIKLVSSDPDKYKYVALLGTYLCQLFLIQWAPDHVHEESEQIAYAAYTAYIGTYNSNEINKHLLTVIMRAQMPVKFLAGGFIPLSLESFGNIIKNVFSFFTVLRNFDL
ncbi:odorant receptor 49b-like [Phymastichus coffea]|uniref:odorant receptor 49b-like n=1 Tax=Phymastichus coffea TaxID=108790 RepID=UPI00273AF083|nr:odorant receptor 49b-like [Phymastichus coffea]